MHLPAAAVSLFLWSCALHSGSSAVEEEAEVGDFCDTHDDCESALLYCSASGVCACDHRKAYHLYDFTRRTEKRVKVLCVYRQCFGDTHGSGCLPGAQCLPYNGTEQEYSGSLCQCPNNGTVTQYDSSTELSCGNDFQLLGADHYCYNTSKDKMCDFNQRLQCINSTCQCPESHYYDTDAPSCFEEGSHYLTAMGSIIPIIALFIILFVIFYLKRKKEAERARLEHEESQNAMINNILQDPAVIRNVQGIPHHNQATAPPHVTQPTAGAADVRSTAPPGFHLIEPPLPARFSDDRPPSYAEATQPDKKTEEKTIEDHYNAT